MAAAKALISAAGLLEKSTATEHATSSSNRVWLGDKDKDKIVALLMWMAQDSVMISDNGKSSRRYRSECMARRRRRSVDDIHKAALAAVLKRGDEATKASRISLNTASIAKLSELIDIMCLNKDGSAKDLNETWAFMRRVAEIRRAVRATSSDNATAVSYTHLTLPTIYSV